jgi:predicted nucleotidyltransferase
MRLSAKQQQTILKTIDTFADNAKVFVFGSRIDDSARGGDVDLIVETAKALPSELQFQIKYQLEEILFLPFDILFVNKEEALTTFQKLAFCDAVELDMEHIKLETAKQQLKDFLVAIDRTIYFLNGSTTKLDFPLAVEWVTERKEDIDFFETLSAINERYSKLQDILAQAMRHGSILIGKDNINFLKVLVFYEKVGVIESMQKWQNYRIMRNEIAHDYSTDYTEITNHFNKLALLIPLIIADAQRFIKFCNKELGL